MIISTILETHIDLHITMFYEHLTLSDGQVYKRFATVSIIAIDTEEVKKYQVSGMILF
jgi:hypothetical protein